MIEQLWRRFTGPRLFLQPDGTIRTTRPDDTPEAPTDRLQLGAHARQLLEDPVLALAFDKLADDLAQTWRSSQVGDREAREEAYRMVWAIEGARSKLRALLGDAKMIEAEHARKEQEQARLQERGLT